MGKRVFFSEYLDIFHSFPQIHSIATIQLYPPWAVQGLYELHNQVLMPEKIYVGLGQWGDSWGKEEIKSEYVFSQFLLCDWIPFLKVTAPLSDLHTTFSVWVQKMLTFLDPTSLILTSLFPQPLVAAPYSAYTLINSPLITLSSSSYPLSPHLGSIIFLLIPGPISPLILSLGFMGLDIFRSANKVAPCSSVLPCFQSFHGCCGTYLEP